jgi:hypothetical protein
MQKKLNNNESKSRNGTTHAKQLVNKRHVTRLSETGVMLLMIVVFKIYFQ